MPHICWPWKIKDPLWTVKANLKKECQKWYYIDLVSFLAWGKKPPSNTAFTASIKTYASLGLQKASSILPLPLHQFSSTILPFFFFLLFFLSPSSVSWLTNVTVFPLYFILQSPSVTSQAHLPPEFSRVKESYRETWDGPNVPLPHLCLSLHYFIHHLTSIPSGEWNCPWKYLMFPLLCPKLWLYWDHLVSPTYLLSFLCPL